MSITECNCNGWKEFVSQYTDALFKDGAFEKGKFLFRGQGDAQWALTSSFDRYYNDMDWGKKRDVETALLNKFRENCIRTFPDEKIETYTDSQLRNLAQHYGLPTRLLDWTYSPYNAAYFAFTYLAWKKDSPDVAIWALNTNHVIWTTGIGVKIEKDLFAVNERQNRQLGVFTILDSPDRSLNDFVKHCENSGQDVSNALIKFTIPKKERTYVLHELDAMDINAYRLMGGYEDCAFAAVVETDLEYR